MNASLPYVVEHVSPALLARATASATLLFLHSPEWIRPPLDLPDLLEGLLLVRVQGLVPQLACGLLREGHEQDVPALHLAAHGDAVDGDRDLRPRHRLRDD